MFGNRGGSVAYFNGDFLGDGSSRFSSCTLSVIDSQFWVLTNCSSLFGNDAQPQRVSAFCQAGDVPIV